MPTALPPRTRHPITFPIVAMGALVTLCVVPIVALFTVGAWLGRGCVTESRTEGDAGANLVWRIDHERCGDGPLVANVLVAPRGKSWALAASSTGAPRPVGVRREQDGTTYLLLDRGGEATTVLLPLKVSGRPSTSLVLVDGRPRR